MKLKNTVVKALSAVAFAAAASASHAVGIFQEFQVTETSVPGAAPNVLTADKLNGAYNEQLTITGGSFVTNAYADFGQFLRNDGTALVPSQLGGIGSTSYGIYATFTSTGVISGSGFLGLTGSFSLYIDPNLDTTKALGATGNDPISLGLNSDDYLIASTSSLTYAVGIPGTPGAFDFIFTDFLLTTTDQDLVTAGEQSGDAYFTSPIPFYVKVRVNGDFDNFDTLPTGDINRSVVGDVSAVFPVPEPSSLALIGLALVGAGAARRRNRSA